MMHACVFSTAAIYYRKIIHQFIWVYGVVLLVLVFIFVYQIRRECFTRTMIFLRNAYGTYNTILYNCSQITPIYRHTLSFRVLIINEIFR